jgi:hypothetical protein
MGQSLILLAEWGSSLKNLACLSFIFFFFPCLLFCSGKRDANSTVKTKPNIFMPAMQEQYITGHWIAVPLNNKITVIGISNPMRRRKDEINAAKEDAARKVALYYGLQGTIDTVNNTGSNFHDYAFDINIDLEYDQDFIKYMDQLTFDPQHDVLICEEGVFIRFQHTATEQNINHKISKKLNARPGWTNNRDLPKIDGFITAVGVSKKQRWLKDTVFKSTENAAANMIEYLSTEIIAKDFDKTGYGYSATIYSKGEGKLKNFLVIEYWIDRETGYIFTLAIAKSDM